MPRSFEVVITGPPISDKELARIVALGSRLRFRRGPFR
jgi:hypothetical protein